MLPARDQGLRGAAAGPGDEDALGEEPRGPRLPTWATRVGGLVAVVALAAFAGPHVLSDGVASAPAAIAAKPAIHARPTPLPRSTSTVPPQMRWPTRGDLADDTHLIEQVRSTLTGSELTSVEEVLWSGRVHGGRGVLVAGFDVRSGIDSADAMPVVGILVAAGRDVAQGQVVRVADLTGTSGQVIAWSLPGGHQVLLVGRPGPLRAELSATVTFTPSGHAQRAWSPIEDADGWALVDVPADDHPALAVRTATRTFAFGDATERHVPDIAVAGLGDQGYAGPEPQTVRALVLHLCFDDPLYGWRASARVSWSGELADGRRGVVVVVTRADGAVFQAAVIGTAAAGATTFGLRPVARTAPERRPYLFVADRAHLGTAPMLIVDPAGRAELRVVSALGTRSFSTDAHGVLTLPADALDAATAVVVRDRFGGREVTVDDLVAADPDGLGRA